MKGNFEYPPEELLVAYPGRPEVLLNAHLIKKQKITPEKLQQLKDLHYRQQGLLEQMEAEKNSIGLRVLADQVKEVNFSLQEVWGFPQDENYHYWWEVPQCTCPKEDNLERYGTKYRIVSLECPIHGK